jgi:hydrogenase-4 component B
MGEPACGELAVSEWLVIAAITLAAASGATVFLRERGDGNERLAAVVLLIAACLGVAGAITAFAGGSHELVADWSVPGGRLCIEVDALSAMFVLQTALIAAVGAIYGLEYWPQAQHRENGRKLRLFYGLVTAGMLLQVVARNALLFLVGWELMAVSAFVLLMIEDEKQEVRDVSYLYALATRFGTLALFAMFALLAAGSGTLDFAGWSGVLSSPLGGAVFVLALVGFGMKAGVMPLHVWLPGAHASTPSHVSALMSGVLIKMGIYGLLRVTALCETPPMWWGHSLLAIGSLSATLGVAFALGQHDLKRLLAYHSVENIGIICLGIGVAVLGRAAGNDTLVVLGLGGAALHTWNHGLFKALLFLGAGSVLHATGTREIDRLGGLWRRMPRTGLAFLVGAVAICGLPPLNGLVSEMLVYLGLFHGSLEPRKELWLACAFVGPALALVGALAVACFVKVFGAVFLGAPRTAAGAGAHDPGRSMLAPMVVLAGCCVVVGIAAPLVAPALDRIAAAWLGRAPSLSVAAAAPLAAVSITSAGLLATIVLGGWWLSVRVRAAPRNVGTWDCGYAAPTVRMQYTASSFAQSLVQLLGWALRPTTHAPRSTAVFPEHASFHSHVPDTVLDGAVLPSFGLAGRLAARLRPLQRGNVHLYLLYILATLIVLLLWS